MDTSHVHGTLLVCWLTFLPLTLVQDLLIPTVFSCSVFNCFSYFYPLPTMSASRGRFISSNEVCVLFSFLVTESWRWHGVWSEERCVFFCRAPDSGSWHWYDWCMLLQSKPGGQPELCDDIPYQCMEWQSCLSWKSLEAGQEDHRRPSAEPASAFSMAHCDLARQSRWYK